MFLGLRAQGVWATNSRVSMGSLTSPLLELHLSNSNYSQVISSKREPGGEGGVVFGGGGGAHEVSSF